MNKNSKIKLGVVIMSIISPFGVWGRRTVNKSVTLGWTPRPGLKEQKLRERETKKDKKAKQNNNVPKISINRNKQILSRSKQLKNINAPQINKRRLFFFKKAIVDTPVQYKLLWVNIKGAIWLGHKVFLLLI